MYFAVASLRLFAVYVDRPDLLFGDARIYFRATDAWLQGANPWLVNNGGISFAAPPPALLLNLLLIPFGESLATIFWVGASALAVVFLLRRIHLPAQWVLFYPIIEGFLAASPDVMLAALSLAGGGAIAALAKPYSIPALLSEARWRAVAAAVALGVGTTPLLPWGTFLSNSSSIGAIVADQGDPNSAWGLPALMILGSAALLALGWRRAFALCIPVLISQQPHYAIFSLAAISRSKLATAGIATPIHGAAAVGVIGLAIVERINHRDSRRAADYRAEGREVGGSQ